MAGHWTDMACAVCLSAHWASSGASLGCSTSLHEHVKFPSVPSRPVVPPSDARSLRLPGFAHILTIWRSVGAYPYIGWVTSVWCHITRFVFFHSGSLGVSANEICFGPRDLEWFPFSLPYLYSILLSSGVYMYNVSSVSTVWTIHSLITNM